MDAPPFKPGDRIRLVEMPDDPCPITPGSLGTVKSVKSLGFLGKPESFYLEALWQVDVAWDDRRSLFLVIPPDRAEKVS